MLLHQVHPFRGLPRLLVNEQTHSPSRTAMESRAPPGSSEHFFQPLIAELRWGWLHRLRSSASAPRDRHFPSPLNDGIWYAVSLEGNNDAWVTLHIETGDKKQTEHIFDTLLRQQEQIQECLAGEWHWNRHNGQNFSSINIRRDGSIDDCVGKLKETRAWMLCTLPKLKQVSEHRVADSLGEPPTLPEPLIEILQHQEAWFHGTTSD